MTFKRTVDSNGDIITSKETQSFSFLSSRMDVFGFALTKIQFFILLTFVGFTLGRHGCKNMNLYVSSFFFCVCVYLCISVISSVHICVYRCVRICCVYISCSFVIEYFFVFVFVFLSVFWNWMHVLSFHHPFFWGG